MSLEREIEIIKGRLAQVEAKLEGGGHAAPATGGGAIASDYEMSGEYGNPVVHKDPPRWKGDSFAGCQLSECPSDYLNELASFHDWAAGKDEENKKTYLHKKSGEQRPTAPLRRKDAALARGWAKRNEGKVIQPATREESDADLDFPI